MERNLRRCEKIAREDGQFGKAIKSLGSHGVAPFSPETTQALRDLHPEGDPVAIRSSFPEGFEMMVLCWMFFDPSRKAPLQAALVGESITCWSAVRIRREYQMLKNI